jgi:hypothetical protein
MKTIEYWQVDSCYDRDITFIGNFTTEADAKKVASKDSYRSFTKRTFTIFDSIEDFENNTREKIRARALAKLSVEEKIALGVK